MCRIVSLFHSRTEARETGKVRSSQATLFSKRGLGTDSVTIVQLKPVWWITLSALIITLVYGALEVSLPLLADHELKVSAFMLGTFWTVVFYKAL